jgi:protein-tyrosine phosphatase
MIASPWWITSQLAIIPRPRGDERLDDDMHALYEAGIDIIVSMLEPAEAKELGLGDEQSSALNAGIALISFPIRDHGIPQDQEKFAAFLSGLERQMLAGRRVGVHCRACIGRSGVVTTSLLIRSGISPKRAWAQISAARGHSVPETAEQKAWVNHNIKGRG